jgi:hypothetical protein
MRESIAPPRAGVIALPDRLAPRQSGARPVTSPTLRALPPIAANPYAAPYAPAPQQIAWRKQLAMAWTRGHLVFHLLVAALATGLILTEAHLVAGVCLLTLAFVSLAITMIALRFADDASPASAALLALLTDGLATAAAVILLGPRLELFALLPGSMLIAALLLNQFFVVSSGVLGLASYFLAVILAQTGVLQPQLALDATATLWFDAALACAGLAMLLVAISLVANHLRAAFAEAGAMAHSVTVLERRAQAKQGSLDADAVALQAEIAKTLRGGAAQPVTSSAPELAPLAQMVNAATTRIPALLRDREERLRLERALRDLTTALEAAWAGFAWQWPTPTGTAVDRLVTILRPQPRPQSETA